MKFTRILFGAALGAITFCAPAAVRANDFVFVSVVAADDGTNDGSSGWSLSGLQGTAQAQAPNTQAAFVHSHAAAVYTYKYQWDDNGPLPTWGEFHVAGILSGTATGSASATATVV